MEKISRFAAALLVSLHAFLAPTTGNAQTSYEEALSLYTKVVTGQIEFESLSPEQQNAVVVIAQMMMSDEQLEGLEFSVRDVARKCEAYRSSPGDDYGELECRGSELRIVERKCEVYFDDYTSGSIECRGSELRPIERKCSVNMYSENYGELSC